MLRTPKNPPAFAGMVVETPENPRLPLISHHLSLCPRAISQQAVNHRYMLGDYSACAPMTIMLFCARCECGMTPRWFQRATSGSYFESKMSPDTSPFGVNMNARTEVGSLLSVRVPCLRSNCPSSLLAFSSRFHRLTSMGNRGALFIDAMVTSMVASRLGRTVLYPENLLEGPIF